VGHHELGEAVGLVRGELAVDAQRVGLEAREKGVACGGLGAHAVHAEPAAQGRHAACKLGRGAACAAPLEPLEASRGGWPQRWIKAEARPGKCMQQHGYLSDWLHVQILQRFLDVSSVISQSAAFFLLDAM
jgi:hypothetical protein